MFGGSSSHDHKATHASQDAVTPPGVEPVVEDIAITLGVMLANRAKLEGAKSCQKFGWNTLGFKMSEPDFDEFRSMVEWIEGDESLYAVTAEVTRKPQYIWVSIPDAPIPADAPTMFTNCEEAEETCDPAPESGDM